MITADVLMGASKTKTQKGADIFRLMTGPNNFLDLNPLIYQKVLDDEIDAVEFDDDTKPMVMDDGTEVKFHKINKTRPSAVSKFRKAAALIDAAKGFDKDAYDKAMKDAEGLVL